MVEFNKKNLIGAKDRTLFFLFLIAFLIHLGATLFVHYAHFQPFSGGYGDYILYQGQAQEIAQRVRQGNFSLQGLGVSHYYPVIIGYIYALTLPKMIIGQLFGVLLAAISVLLTYLIVLEISGSKKWAFLIGLIVCFYPSYLFFGSLLLKDTLVVPLVLAGLLLNLKLIKNFFWRNFMIFYIVLGVVIHFRFYVGYALLFTFIPCWLLLSKLNLKKKFIYGIIIIVLLGFLPQFSGNGYYGIATIKGYLNPKTITYYREEAYVSSASSAPTETEINRPLNFLVNYLQSSIYILLGPLPWQIKHSRQLFVLLETIPWYFLLFFAIKGAFITIKSRRLALPLLIFSAISLGILALFITNFGIITRIRIPSFISFSCLIPLAFIRKNKEGVKKGNNKIKVCYLTNIDKSVKFILFNQLKFLKNDGYEVYVVCSSGNFIKNIEAEGIKVKIINFKRGINPFSHLVTLFKLIFYFKKEKFDIIHTHTPVPGLLGQLAAKIAGIPIIVNTIHGFYFQKRDSWIKRKFFVLIEKAAAECSDLIFFVNKEDMKVAIEERICASDLIKYFGGGINISQLNPENFSQQWIYQKKRELNLKPNFKIIGIVGRLVKEKGYLDLFEAFKKVLEKFSETLLLVIGPLEPKKRDRVNPAIVKKYKIEENVIFLGERSGMDKFYPLMDIFVLPSYREGLGISILEASAMRKPVITTNIRGCREAVENGKTGILVPLKNPEKLAEAIIYLLESPETVREMGERGREKIEREFDEKIIFERIKREYERLIKEKLKK